MWQQQHQVLKMPSPSFDRAGAAQDIQLAALFIEFHPKLTQFYRFFFVAHFKGKGIPIESKYIDTYWNDMCWMDMYRRDTYWIDTYWNDAYWCAWYDICQQSSERDESSFGKK